MQLFPTFANADGFGAIRFVRRAQLGVHQPQACARKQSSNSPARNCGRPKRSRVK
jgi:hypothetical protein